MAGYEAWTKDLQQTTGCHRRTLEGSPNGSSLPPKTVPLVAKSISRMSHAVSRRQEFTADTLAARIVGYPSSHRRLKLTYGAAYASTRIGSTRWHRFQI